MPQIYGKGWTKPLPLPSPVPHETEDLEGEKKNLLRLVKMQIAVLKFIRTYTKVKLVEWRALPIWDISWLFFHFSYMFYFLLLCSSTDRQQTQICLEVKTEDGGKVAGLKPFDYLFRRNF